MRFLESWTVLAATDLVRLLTPLLFTGLLVGLPGRASARFLAFAIAAGVFIAPELIPAPGLHAAWIAIWVAIGWTVGRGGPTPRASRRLGLLESGAIGLLIGVALLVILLATFGRQDLPHDETRRTSLGLALVVLGLLHLMTRRHTVRAAAGLAAMGLGLQIVDVVAWETLAFRAHGPSPAIAGATAIAAALAVRIGRIRERVATSPWVGDAHDLHD
jgi:hypothetical protein